MMVPALSDASLVVRLVSDFVVGLSSFSLARSFFLKPPCLAHNKQLIERYQFICDDTVRVESSAQRPPQQYDLPAQSVYTTGWRLGPTVRPCSGLQIKIPWPAQPELSPASCCFPP